MTDEPEAPKLTFKERAFADAYLGPAKGNGTDAAAMAGYAATKRHTLAVQGSRLLTKANVRAYMDAALKARAASVGQVLAELTDVALGDPAKTALVLSGEFGPVGYEFPLRGADKVKALELLAKYHGLLTDRVQHEGEVLIRRYVGVDVDAV